MKHLYYKKGLNIGHAKECFNFIKDHYKYYTLSSWNGLRSIANNVKLYNLELDVDMWKAYSYLNETDYDLVKYCVYDFESTHPGYRIYFNGRSSGYLVMYNKDNNLNIIPNYIDCMGSYEDFKIYCRDYYGGVNKVMPELKQLVKDIRDFDLMCDEIRYNLNELVKLQKGEWE